MIVKAFKSEHTGELFDNEQDYKNHIQQHEEQKALIENQKILFSKRKDLMEAPRNTATSIEDFRNKMFDVVCELNQGNPDQLLGLFFNNIYFGWCSNSHCCPINGVKNWSQKDENKPTGYYGWKGSVTIIFSEKRNTGENRDNVERIVKQFPAFNSGSGGYRGVESNGLNGYVLEYELTLFLDDFPLIKKQYERYVELSEKKQGWTNFVNGLFDEKNKSDSVIVSYNNAEKDLQQQIDELTAEMNTISSNKYSRIQSNNNQVLSENTFTENDELNNLINDLKIKYFKP